MFSGIIEEKAFILTTHEPSQKSGTVVIEMLRPKTFDDIKIGDSIAVNGVCLTVEVFNDEKMQFTLGPETLKITKWTAKNLLTQELNLERSMKLGDRIHGHIVSGHVDTLGQIEVAHMNGEAFDLVLSLEKSYRKYFPKKSSWTVAGVSLTVNEVEMKNERVWISSCLIPETLKKTNLAQVKVGQGINIEIDFMIRALIHSYEERFL